MPGLITHNYFAANVIDSLDRGALDVIDRNFDAYVIGAQGPDILFGLKVSKPAFRSFANLVHEKKCKRTFDAAADYVRDTGDGAAFAFMLGMSGHYALDKTVHPYVYFKARGEMKGLYPPQFDDSSRHIALETRLDNFVVNELAGSTYKGVLRGGSLLPFDKDVLKSLDGLFVNAVAPIYGVPLKKGMASSSAKRTKSFFAVTNGGRGIAYRIAEIVETTVYKNKALTGFFPNRVNDDDKLDAPNLKGGVWYRELGGNTPTKESFPDMLERAKKDAPRYINAFYRAVNSEIPLEKSDFILNYNGEKYD